MIQLAAIAPSIEFSDALSRVPGIVLTEPTSPDASDTGAVVGTKGVKPPSSTLAAILGSATVDAVYLSGSGPFRPDLCQAVLDAGKHLLVSEPATSTSREFTSLLRTARTRNLILLEATPGLYEPGLQMVRGLLPRLGTVRRSSLAYFGSVTGVDPKLTAGSADSLHPPQDGPLETLACHCVGTLDELFGAPQHVVASEVTSSSRTVARAVATFDGMVADISYSEAATQGTSSLIRGEFGDLWIDNVAQPSQVQLWTRGAWPEEFVVDRATTGSLGMIERFVQLISGREAPRLDDERTLRKLRTMEMVRASATSWPGPSSA